MLTNDLYSLEQCLGPETGSGWAPGRRGSDPSPTCEQRNCPQPHGAHGLPPSTVWAPQATRDRVPGIGPPSLVRGQPELSPTHFKQDGELHCNIGMFEVKTSWPRVGEVGALVAVLTRSRYGWLRWELLGPTLQGRQRQLQKGTAPGGLVGLPLLGPVWGRAPVPPEERQPGLQCRGHVRGASRLPHSADSSEPHVLQLPEVCQHR